MAAKSGVNLVGWMDGQSVERLVEQTASLTALRWADWWAASSAALLVPTKAALKVEKKAAQTDETLAAQSVEKWDRMKVKWMGE
jgi:hypothetical protein